MHFEQPFLRQVTFYLLLLLIAVALIQTSGTPEVVRDIRYYLILSK